MQGPFMQTKWNKHTQSRWACKPTFITDILLMWKFQFRSMSAVTDCALFLYLPCFFILFTIKSWKIQNIEWLSSNLWQTKSLFLSNRQKKDSFLKIYMSQADINEWNVLKVYMKDWRMNVCFQISFLGRWRALQITSKPKGRGGIYRIFTVATNDDTLINGNGVKKGI